MHRLVAFGPYYSVSFLSLLLRNMSVISIRVQGAESSHHWMVKGDEDWEGCCIQYSLCSLNSPQFFMLYSHRQPPFESPSPETICFIPSRKQASRILPGLVWDRHSRSWSGEGGKGIKQLLPWFSLFYSLSFQMDLVEYSESIHC